MDVNPCGGLHHPDTNIGAYEMKADLSDAAGGVFDVKINVTAPLLPRRFSFDARREIGVIHEVVKEFMPGLGGDTGVADHVRQLFDSVIGQCGDCFVGSDVNADDVSIGQVVVVVDDRFKKFGILAQHFGDVVNAADMGHRSHQAACEWAAASGTQFHGSSSSSLLIL